MRPNDTSYFYQQVEFEEVDGGVQIRCDSPESECVHFLPPDKYQAFLGAIGQHSAMSVIEGAKVAVRKNKRPLVFEAAHEHAEVKFSWYDWDSPFYGDKAVEVEIEPGVDQSNTRFYSRLSDFEKLSDGDKELFVQKLALKFFPENNETED